MKEANIRLIQLSFPCTGSTILANILQGLFYPDEPIYVHSFLDLKNIDQVFTNFIIKTHNTDTVIFDGIRDYDLWFITSSREHRRINKHSKLINFEYKDLLETSENTIEVIVNRVSDTLKRYLPRVISDQIQVKSGVERVERMNKAYKAIEHLPFSHIDTFYGIHGSHKGRWGTESDLRIQHLIDSRDHGRAVL